MATLERRVETLESMRSVNKSVAEMTDRELLSLIAPDYTGPMPSDDELPAFIEVCMAKQGIPWPQCSIGPTEGGAHGDA